MLDETRTRQKRTREMDVLSTDSVVEAGLALTGAMETGTMKARRSNGVANTVFLGVSWITNSRGSLTAAKLLQAKTGAADSGGTGFALVTLPYPVSLNSDTLALLGVGYGSAAPLTLATDKASTTTATTYFVATNSNQLFVANSNANKDIFISFRYSPTVQQSYFLYGDNYIPKASVAMNRIGILEEGQIWTSNFDPTVDWSTVDTYATNEALVCGVNGQFTVNKTGAICSKCYVLEAPKIGSPYLGLYIHV